MISLLVENSDTVEAFLYRELSLIHILIAAIMAAIAGLIIFVPKGLVFLGLL